MRILRGLPKLYRASAIDLEVELFHFLTLLTHMMEVSPPIEEQKV